jgi:hypothetical protein
MKRLATEESRELKRQKQHVSTCNDINCTGCDVGEIEISLPEMTGLEIYSLAKEESNKVSLSSEDIDSSTQKSIVIKLFEMAIAEFEKEKSTLMSCQCLFDFAKFLVVKETMEQARTALESLLHTESDHEAWLLLGRIYLELATFDYTDAQSDDEDIFVPAKSVLELVKKSIHTFKKAVEMVKDETKKNALIICSGSLLDHALIQKHHHLVPDHIKETLMAALSFCSKDKSLLDSRITGTILFHLASIESHKKIPCFEMALELANESILFLKQVTEMDPKASDYQLVFFVN